MTRHPLARQIALKMRDARGRFVLVRATLAEMVATKRHRVRRPVGARSREIVQLSLFPGQPPDGLR